MLSAVVLKIVEACLVRWYRVYTRGPRPSSAWQIIDCVPAERQFVLSTPVKAKRRMLSFFEMIPKVSEESAAPPARKLVRRRMCRAVQRSMLYLSGRLKETKAVCAQLPVPSGSR